MRPRRPDASQLKARGADAVINPSHVGGGTGQGGGGGGGREEGGEGGEARRWRSAGSGRRGLKSGAERGERRPPAGHSGDGRTGGGR